MIYLMEAKVVYKSDSPVHTELFLEYMKIEENKLKILEH